VAEDRLRRALEAWWETAKAKISDLPKAQNLMQLRSDLLETFDGALLPIGLLDRFAVSGVVASWWGEVQYDLKALMARDFEGLVDGWITTILAALADEEDKSDPLEHRLVHHLIPEFLTDVASAEAAVVELKGRLEAAIASDENEDGQESNLSDADVKDLKKKLTAARKHRKEVRAAFAGRVKDASSRLSSGLSRDLALRILAGVLSSKLSGAVDAQRHTISGAVTAWWGKYKVPLPSVESARREAAASVSAFLRELGYE